MHGLDLAPKPIPTVTFPAPPGHPLSPCSPTVLCRDPGVPEPQHPGAVGWGRGIPGGRLCHVPSSWIWHWLCQRAGRGCLSPCPVNPGGQPGCVATVAPKNPAGSPGAGWGGALWQLRLSPLSPVPLSPCPCQPVPGTQCHPCPRSLSPRSGYPVFCVPSSPALL